MGLHNGETVLRIRIGTSPPSILGDAVLFPARWVRLRLGVLLRGCNVMYVALGEGLDGGGLLGCGSCASADNRALSHLNLS